ncbi:BrxA family protein [Thiocystis violacea]|uniref:BrxA family protein n=1 Tax=Thiocystis violacea TaxID=13725 RepID=UPI003B831190
MRRHPVPASKTSWRFSGTLSCRSVGHAGARDTRPWTIPVALEKILYFHAARADRLLSDVVTEILVPMHEQGLTDLQVTPIQRSLTQWAEAGKTTGHWPQSTIDRITRGLLAALRDFGVLQGIVHKKIAPSFLQVETFAYIMFYLKQHQPSGSKLIELPDWKLFFLTRDGVKRLLFDAHQHELLEYHVAGSVTRLTFPAATLEEYAQRH